jgi:hypothetical protein
MTTENFTLRGILVSKRGSPRRSQHMMSPALPTIQCRTNDAIAQQASYFGEPSYGATAAIAHADRLIRPLRIVVCFATAVRLPLSGHALN